MTAGRKVNNTSKSWGTPEKYISAVKEVFGGSIDLDPCSNIFSIVGAKNEYILPKDGLLESWDFKNIFVNPPYGKDKERKTSIKDWLRKCSDSYDSGSSILALIPVSTNTSHWKEYIFPKATGICFLYDTRLRFLENGLDTGKGAPMACSMIYWGDDNDKFYKVFKKYGYVIKLK